MYGWICAGAFLVSFAAGAASRFLTRPSWAREYDVRMTDEVGTVEKDFSYGPESAEKFDLYLPADPGRQGYGLVVYIHAGGFTSGDKSDDAGMLAWLCSQGYVAAGINYTLRTDQNGASVLSQSIEIKSAIPEVVKAAEAAGYPIRNMAIGGGSAGGTLAMLYAFRDAKDAPVPLRFLFEAVGPSSFERKDWHSYGLDKDTPESRTAAAGLFGIMLGQKIDPSILDTPEYHDVIKPISGYMWVTPDSVPTVIVYGTHDKVCPFDSSRHLVQALKENHVPYEYFELPHSGHGLQNDSRIYRTYMDAVKEGLAKYLDDGDGKDADAE